MLHIRNRLFLFKTIYRFPLDRLRLRFQYLVVLSERGEWAASESYCESSRSMSWLCKLPTLEKSKSTVV